MTRWAIGDIQGCMSSLERLLEAISFDRRRDTLWLVGDLVNRGPRSLDVLRFVAGLGESARVVLGNHDIHLLGRVADTAKPKKRDTLDDILNAPDRDALINFLRTRPFCHVEDGFVMIHAGLHPQWSVATAQALSAELSAELSCNNWVASLRALGPGREVPLPWQSSLLGLDRRQSALSYFTRVRMCTLDGVADPNFDGPAVDAPAGLIPWFALPQPAWSDHVPVFGHWAANGLSITPTYLALDSGCVWGRQLSAVRLDDRHVVRVAAAESRIT